jgi:hypothetical protein
VLELSWSCYYYWLASRSNDFLLILHVFVTESVDESIPSEVGNIFLSMERLWIFPVVFIWRSSRSGHDY